MQLDYNIFTKDQLIQFAIDKDKIIDTLTNRLTAYEDRGMITKELANKIHEEFPIILGKE